MYGNGSELWEVYRGYHYMLVVPVSTSASDDPDPDVRLPGFVSCLQCFVLSRGHVTSTVK